MEIIVKDFIGNSSSIKIPIIGERSESLISQQQDTTNYKIVKNKFHKFSKKGVTIAFPKNTFYEDIYLNFSVNDKQVNIHKPTIPLNKSFTISFDSTMYKKTELDKFT